MRTFTVVALLASLHCGSASPEPPKMSEKSNASTVTITGVATTEGVECPAVRGDDGTLYTIVGLGREKLTAGVRVKITGTLVRMSTCMQGTTISASSIEVLPARR